MKLRTGDKVVVITGKDRGKTGTIVRVFPETERVIVEGANKQKKHMKAQGQHPGGIIEREASMHISNVMLVDPKTNKRSRVGYRVTKTGTKERISKKSGETIVATKAASKKAATSKK